MSAGPSFCRRLTRSRCSGPGHHRGWPQPNFLEPPLCFSSGLAFFPFPINSRCPARSPNSFSVLATRPDVYFFCSLSALVDLGFLTLAPLFALDLDGKAGFALDLTAPWAILGLGMRFEEVGSERCPTGFPSRARCREIAEAAD